jgi:hypothetical protein
MEFSIAHAIYAEIVEKEEDLIHRKNKKRQGAYFNFLN